MAIDPTAIGATTEPMLFEWTDRDTMLYALGVGAGLEDLSFTTENSHDIPQQVLPTYAVIACPAFGAGGLDRKVQLGLAVTRLAVHPAACAAAGLGEAVGGLRRRRHPGQGRGQERHRHAAWPRHRPGYGRAGRGNDEHRGHPAGRRVRGSARSAAGRTRIPGPRARRPHRPTHPRGSSPDLSALR